MDENWITDLVLLLEELPDEALLRHGLVVLHLLHDLRSLLGELLEILIFFRQIPD